MADDLRVEIGADPSGLGRGLSEAERRIDAFVSRVERIGDVGQKLTSLGTTLTASLTLPIIGLGGAAIKAYGDIQSLQKGLEAVMGTTTLANEEFNQLKEVAKLPGLGMQEAVKGSINLQAIGISAQKSRNILMQFGNAVATVGKGREEFERSIYGVQQLANTDFPLGEDLNIIKDALPQVSNLLKEAFGTSRSDELAKLGVTSQQVLDTILVGLGKLPRVTGGIKGAFENLGDSMKTSLGRIGKIIDDNFDISSIIDKITNFVDKAISAFESLDPTLQKVILGVAGVVAAAGPLIAALGAVMSMVPTLTAGVGALSAVFTALTGPIGLVTLGIVGVVTAVVSNWDKIRPYLEETIDRFKRLYNESVVFGGAIRNVGFMMVSTFEVGKIGLKTLWENFKAVGKGILDVWSGIGDTIEGVLTLDFDLLSKGLQKGFLAVNRSITSVYVNGAAGLSLMGDALEKTQQKFANFKFDLSNKTDLSVKLGEQIEKETEKGIVNGVKKGLSKAAAQKIEIPEVTAASIGGAGLIDGLGNEYKTFNDFMLGEAKRTDMIMNTSLPQIFSDSEKNMLEAAVKTAAAIEELNQSFNQIVNNGISDAIADSMAAMGTAIATGENVLRAVGKSLLGSFGSILTQLGKAMISYGVHMLALKVAMKSMNPYVAMAAGFALVAIGSMMGSTVSGMSDSIGGGGGGSSSSVSTSTGANASSNYSSSYSNSNFSGVNEVVLRVSGPDLISVINRNVVAADRLTSG